MSSATIKQFFTGILGVALFAMLLAFAGCKKGDEGGSSDSGSSKSTGEGKQAASSGGASDGTGEGIFKAHACGNCHTIGGAGGRMGPELTKVGAESEHTEQWLADHIKNPKTHKPNSTMPAYEGKINDKDMETLTKYLASLK